MNNNISVIKTTYLSLLRHALGLGTSLTEIPSCHLQDLISLANRQNTLPLIADALLSLPDPQGALEPYAPTLKQAALGTMMRYQQHRAVLTPVINALEEGGMHPILLKGLSLAALYPKPYLRPWGDLDVLVEEQYQDTMIHTIEALYPTAEHNIEYEGEMRHLNFDLPGGGLIEVHRATRVYRNPRLNAAYQSLEAEAKAHTHTEAIEGFSYRVLEPNFNLLFVFIHAWEHFTESQNMTFRHLVDILLLQRHILPSIRPDYLKAALSRFHLLSIWQMVQYILVTHLGLPQEDMVLYSDRPSIARRAERLLSAMLQGGTYRHFATTGGYLARKWSTFRFRFQKVSLLLPYSPRLAADAFREILAKGLSRMASGEDRAEKKSNWDRRVQI